MTSESLYHFLEDKLPQELSAKWDNDGAACLPFPEKQVKRVLVALDATEEAVKKAVDEGFDLLLTHHPLLFRGITELTPYHTVSRKLLAMVTNKVAAFSFHTRLDAAKGGVNDILCAILGIAEAVAFGPEGDVPCGRVGMLQEPTSAVAFADTVRKVLGAEAVSLIGNRTVQKIAVLGGEGGDYVSAARAVGADLFLSGHIGYHRMLDAAEEGMALIEAGHYETEYPVCAYLADLVRAADDSIVVEIMPTKKIKTMH